MQVVECIVSNQRLTRHSSNAVAANSYKFVKFQFNIRTGWENVDHVFANFLYNDQSYQVELDQYNQCYVPEGVLQPPEFQVFLYGNGVITNMLKIKVEDMGVVYKDNNTAYHASLINKFGLAIKKERGD